MKNLSGLNAIKRYTVLAVIIWTVFIAAMIIQSVGNERQQTRELVWKEADSIYSKDQAFRQWGISHGGVYVNPDDRTPPNPYLSHVPDRDIMTTKGKKLTLMNPAYMMRQMMAEYSEAFGVRTRITSLKIVNPVNEPDDWEAKALIAFAEGQKEFSEFVDINGEPFFRLMRPMITKEACLKCHGYQGYEVGDVRGGVDVSVPMRPYLNTESKAVFNLYVSHGIIWIMGLGFIGYISKKSRQHIIDRKHYEDNLREERDFSDHAINSLPGIFYIYERYKKLLRWNDNALRVTGYTSDEIKRMKLLDLVSYEEKRAAENSINRCFENGETELETILLTKDRKKIPYYFTGMKIMINTKECMIGTGTDISRRKEAEEELNRHRGKLEDIVDERTEELKQTVNAMAGREVRMAELKKVIKVLRKQLGDAGITPEADDPLKKL